MLLLLEIAQKQEQEISGKMLQDKVNLSFWVDGLLLTVITSREQANDFKTQWLDMSANKITVLGNCNNADSNSMELSFDSNRIDGIQIMELNKF